MTETVRSTLSWIREQICQSVILIIIINSNWFHCSNITAFRLMHNASVNLYTPKLFKLLLDLLKTSENWESSTMMLSFASFTHLVQIMQLKLAYPKCLRICPACRNIWGLAEGLHFTELYIFLSKGGIHLGCFKVPALIMASQRPISHHYELACEACQSHAIAQKGWKDKKHFFPEYV